MYDEVDGVESRDRDAPARDPTAGYTAAPGPGASEFECNEMAFPRRTRCCRGGTSSSAIPNLLAA